MKAVLDYKTHEFKNLIYDGRVIVNTHNDFPLSIYNYSATCQYENNWNEYLLSCRGLILDENYNVVSRPFNKFFNYEELDASQIPNEPYTIHEKVDGSLGILYFWNDKPYIATRGSFHSEQAIKANQMLNTKYETLIPNLDPRYTYLFEIVYPENRIVVNYGEVEALILLAVIETSTGIEIPTPDIGFLTPYSLTNKSISELISLDIPNEEGFVLRFESGFRVKIKFAEYKRLHKLITNVNDKDIWEMLKNNENMEHLLTKVPDEFYNWVTDTKDNLTYQYKALEKECNDLHRSNVFETKKEAAMWINTQKHKSILFNMLNDKDYSELIWKAIKPKVK